MQKQNVIVAPMTAHDVAEYIGVTLPTVWKGVAEGRLPRPFYPAPRAPRWRQAEIDAAMEAARMLPREAMAARRDARLAAHAAHQAA